MTDNATPRPWDWFTDFGPKAELIKERGAFTMRTIVGANGQGLARTVGLRAPQDDANADLICEAVNSHDALKAENEDLKRVAASNLQTSIDYLNVNNRIKSENAALTERVKVLEGALKALLPIQNLEYPQELCDFAREFDNARAALGGGK